MDLAAVFRAALEAHRGGRLAEAEEAYRAVLAHVEHPLSLHNLALILEERGGFDDAGALFLRAADAAPDDPARQFALAISLRTRRRLDEAEARYRRVLELDPAFPKAAFDLGCVLLAAGRDAEGWPLYDQREARQAMLQRKLSIPEWRGEPLAGKRLLVLAEQGFGDQIMMARFLSGLGAETVTYVGLPQLRRLFEQLSLTFVAGSPGGPAPPGHDYWVLPLSLPHRLGAGPERFPPPYFSGTPGRAPGGVGVVWRGEPTNRNDRFRTLPEAEAARLLALPGAISLDPADSGATDFQATADIIAGLDLVITVDTAVAHLAGAMGRPVWVLLAAQALDWQWPRAGRSPWYPQVRLFVQSTAGDWTSVVDQVVEAAARR